MDTYVLILWIGIVIGGVGAGLIWFTHYLDRKEDSERTKWVMETMLPAAKSMTMEIMDECVDKVMSKTVEMTKKMMNDNFYDEDDEEDFYDEDDEDDEEETTQEE